MLEETGEVKSKERTTTHSQQNGSFITKYNTQLNYTCGARGMLLSFLWTSKEALLRYARQFCQVGKSNTLDFITQTLKASHDLFLLTLWCSIKDVRKKAVGMFNSKANIPKDGTMQASVKRDVLLFPPSNQCFLYRCYGRRGARKENGTPSASCCNPSEHLVHWAPSVG